MDDRDPRRARTFDGVGVHDKERRKGVVMSIKNKLSSNRVQKSGASSGASSSSTSQSRMRTPSQSQSADEYEDEESRSGDDDDEEYYE